MMNVTIGQHPGLRSTPVNRWRSTAERVQGPVRRKRAARRRRAWPVWDHPTPDVDAPPAPTWNGPATFADASRTFRFATCGPVFRPEPSLCGGEAPSFHSRFLPVSTQRGVRPIPRSALEVPERPSRCAVTPSACRWVSRRKTAPRCDTWRLKRLCFLVLLLILNPVLSQLSWLSGRCTGLRRELRRSFCAVRVFPFNVALAAPGPVPRGLARVGLAVPSRLASTQEQAAAPRQREQRVSATLSKVEETQRQSAETRCLRCRSGLGLLFPCAGGPGPHLVCRPAPLPLRRLSWQCRPTVCCGSRRALAWTTATLDLAAESASLESPSSPHLRRAWNHRHLLALQSVAIVLPPGRAAAPDRDECSGGSCCRRGGPYWPERRGATCPAPAPAWNGYGGVRAT